jgi:rare lipoprotein A
MKQVLLTGLAAALTVTVAGEVTSSEASPDPQQSSDQNSISNSKQVTANQTAPTQNLSATKVGERQSASGETESGVARVLVHVKNGRQATTVYVRNIPIVTFLGAEQSAANSQGVKVATTELDLLS